MEKPIFGGTVRNHLNTFRMHKTKKYIPIDDDEIVNIYYYWLHGGYWTIIIKKILDLLQMLYVFLFMIFSIYCVNYRTLFKTYNLHSSITLSDYNKVFHHFFTLINLVIFIIFWVFNLFKFLYKIPKYNRMKALFERLDIDPSRTTWDDITLHIYENWLLRPRSSFESAPLLGGGGVGGGGNGRSCGSSGSAGGGGGGRNRYDDLSEDGGGDGSGGGGGGDGISYQNRKNFYVQKILQRDNFIIGLYTLIIDIRIQYINKYFLPSLLKWCIEKIIVFFFMSNLQIFGTRHAKIEKLKNFFRFVGFILMICCPFLFLYAAIYAFFKHFQELKMSPQLASLRDFNNYSRLKFRHFNELPHEFEERLRTSREYANKFVDNFRNPLSEIVFTTIAFLSGSLLSIITMLFLIDQHIMMSDFLWGQNILFYAAFVGVVFSVSHSYMDGKKTNLHEGIQNFIELTKRLTPKIFLVFENYKHAYPIIPQDRPLPSTESSNYINWSSHDIYENLAYFKKFYEYRLFLLLVDIVSIFITPIILMFYMTSISRKIFEFFKSYTVEVPGIGSVCQLSIPHYLNYVDDPVYKSKMLSSINRRRDVEMTTEDDTGPVAERDLEVDGIVKTPQGSGGDVDNVDVYKLLDSSRFGPNFLDDDIVDNGGGVGASVVVDGEDEDDITSASLLLGPNFDRIVEMKIISSDSTKMCLNNTH